MPSGENQPTLQAVRTVFFDLEDPREPLTATDVADAIGCSRRTAFNKLTSLVERGDLRTKKTGASGRVFWRPRQTAASQTAPGDDLDSRLTSEQMRELEFRSDALGQPLVDAADGDVTVTVDSVVPLPDGTYLEYWDATGISAEKLLAMQEHFPSNLGGRLLSTTGDRCRVEMHVDADSLLATFDQFGGRTTSGIIEEGTITIVAVVPLSVDATAVVDAVTDSRPELEFVDQRLVYTPRLFSQLVEAELTERQWTALQIAYNAGYYSVPRVSTGAEIADRMDVTRQTLHHHLRRAEATLLSQLFDEPRLDDL